MRSKRGSRIGKKLNSSQGLSWITIVLAVAVVVAAILILVIPGYLNHFKDLKLTYDTKSVITARDVASVQYLTDGQPGIMVYYYDEVSHSVKDRSQIGSIQGYGRCSARENYLEETGAAGIPSLPEEDGGAQLLAVTVTEQGVLHVRWTGKVYTWWDYEFMLDRERELLTDDDLRQMDRSSERTAVRRARARYDQDFRQQLQKEEETPPVRYNYDLVEDVLYLDESSSDLFPEQGDQVRSCQEIAPYSLSDVTEEPGVVQVTVTGEDATAEWLPGSTGEGL